MHYSIKTGKTKNIPMVQLSPTAQKSRLLTYLSSLTRPRREHLVLVLVLERTIKSEPPVYLPMRARVR